ncbi:hypothetical protein [Streptomyces sp. RerS4]|uniref:hypothetical protein n=1 Tax=Streptomyces sp. RerS4 TaxID=2942449 RepID=UPI00201BC703|nr:hypothetical protein [Streptomyces sp. RerS4]UQX01362.1 hypothetical protein M4D82_13120 [Streptomyces sp. RerS4]
MHAFPHAEIHAARTAELAAEAAAWRLARQAAPCAPAAPAPSAAPSALSALRNRAGEALVHVGIRLMQPAHLHARLQGHAT